MGTEFFEGVDDLDRLDQLILPGLHARESGGCVWSYLCEAGEALNARAFDFDSTLATILDITLELTRADRAALMLMGDAGQFSVCLARDREKKGLGEKEFKASRTIVDKVLSEGKPIFSGNLAEDPVFSQSESVRELKLTSAMCVPVRVRTREDTKEGDERRLFGKPARVQAVGVLYVDASGGTHTFGERDLWIFQALANQAAAVLQNARLYSQIAMDEVTRLFSRHYFETRLLDIARSSALEASPVAIVIVDIDNFYALRVKHGEAAGDKVLRAVAQTIRVHLRASDLPARYGADEFVMLLPDTDASGAETLAEKVRAAVAGASFGEIGAVTVSVGVASFPSHGETPQEVVFRADQALHRAKSGGRNKVVVWRHGRDEREPRADRLAGILCGDPAKDYRNVEVLLELIEALHGVTGRREVLRIAMTRLLQRTRADRCLVFLKTDTGDHVLASALDRDGKDLSEVHYSQSMVEKVEKTLQAVHFVEALDPKAPSTESVRELGIVRALCVPMIAHRLAVGAVYLDSRSAHDSVLAEDAAFVQAMTTQVALALASA